MCAHVRVAGHVCLPFLIPIFPYILFSLFVYYSCAAYIFSRTLSCVQGTDTATREGIVPVRLFMHTLSAMLSALLMLDSS